MGGGVRRARKDWGKKETRRNDGNQQGKQAMSMKERSKNRDGYRRQDRYAETMEG